MLLYFVTRTGGLYRKLLFARNFLAKWPTMNFFLSQKDEPKIISFNTKCEFYGAPYVAFLSSVGTLVISNLSSTNEMKV